MSEQNWGCLDKMSEVNFSPAETLSGSPVMGGHVILYTIKISLTKTVFSFASSVDALQNTMYS